MTRNEREETVHKYLFIHAAPRKEDGVYLKPSAGTEGERSRERKEEKEKISPPYAGDGEGELQGAVLRSLKC